MLQRIINNTIQEYKDGGLLYMIKQRLSIPLRKHRAKEKAKRQDELLQSVLRAQLPDCRILSKQTDPEVVVSLTSFPARFDSLEICLKSLLLQERKPDKIIVYFGSDVLVDQMPKWMNQFESYGVEFILKDGNLKPHKKYFYAMQEYKNSIVITVDDDVVYPSDMVKQLLECHAVYPTAVCARRVHKIKFNRKNEFAPYSTWERGYRKTTKPSNSLLAIGEGGILYPPLSISSLAFDSDIIKRHCLDADDIWLKCMEIINGTKVVWAKNSIGSAEIPNSQNVALKYTNTGTEGKNDMYFRDVMKAYNISFVDFMD